MTGHRDAKRSDTISGSNPFLLRTSSDTMNAYENVAVATDQALCSKIGTHVLRELNGTAADAAVAVALSLGVVNFQSSGLGGGGFLVYYDSATKESTAINFREKAPKGINETLLVEELAQRRGLIVGVPGELKGLERLWQKHGRVEWQKLFDTAADVAESGFPVTNWTERALGSKDETTFTDQLKSFLKPDSKRYIVEGDHFSAQQLGRTLRQIGAHGNADPFYKGQLAHDMVKEINAAGGVFTYEDFATYDVEETPTMKSNFMGMTVCSAPPPSSGAVTQYVLNILSKLGEDLNVFDDDARHLIAEALKFGFAARMRLGDTKEAREFAEELLNPDKAEKAKLKIDFSTTHLPEYYDGHYVLPDEEGTTHFCIVDGEGNAVSLTSTVGLYFGSRILSESLGFLYNSHLTNFSKSDKYDPSYNLVPNPTNYLRPGKRPQSSTSPLILLDQNDTVVATIGASGAHMIISSVVSTLLKYFVFGYALDEAINEPRFHHQLVPDVVCVQEDFPDEWTEGFEARGHVVECAPRRLAAVQAIVKEKGKFVAVCDYRKKGEPDGY